MFRIGMLTVLTLLAGGLEAGRASAAVADPNFTETLFSPGLSELSGIAWPPDGSNRLFFTRKTGTIEVIENGTLLDQVFATVSPLFNASECGLIGLAFDPNFSSNHYLYVFVTVSGSEQRILRYTDNGNVGEDPTVLMSGLPTRGRNHDGGAVGIGPDGKLYWAIGDNGNATGVDDDLLSLAAKVGRANLDGSAPNDNPFHDGVGPNNDYIWARGFRNPFTFTWQPSTEELWVNVTGAAYEQIFSVSKGDHAGWNNYQSDQPVGFIAPTISYRTRGVDTRVITPAGAVRQNGVATFTTDIAHRFRPGAKIVVSGVADVTFNQTDYVVDVPSPTEFIFRQPGPNATSGEGTAVSQLVGGALTGGTFWDSSGAPPSHVGDFFFGDYNSGRVMRAVLDTQSKVISVDEFATGNADSIDMEVGPDGNLYYAQFSGPIHQVSYNFASQALIVSRLHVRMSEGGGSAFGVRLAIAPSGPRSVTVSRTSGDADVSVVDGATLSFEASDWAVPQTVTVAAAQDSDSVDDEAIIRVVSGGLLQDVRVRVTDDNDPDGTSGEGGTGGAAAAGAPGSTESGGAPDSGGVAGALGAGGEEAPGPSAGGQTSAGGASDVPTQNSDGCGCRAIEAGRKPAPSLALLLLLAAVLSRRRSGATLDN